jgi:signal peptidase I
VLYVNNYFFYQGKRAIDLFPFFIGRNMKLANDKFKDITIEILRMGYAVRFKASGGSMSPVISHNDIVTVGPIKESSINTNDIVYLNSEEEGLLIHKVIAVFEKNGKAMVLTKGDASAYPDKPVPVESVLGKVISIEKP